MPTLIHYPLCPFSRSIRLAASECDLGLVLEEERPWAWRAEFLEINPGCILPMYHDDDGVTLYGAYPISEFLSETGVDATGDVRAFSFFPGDEAERGEVRRLTNWFHLKFNSEVTEYLIGEKSASPF